LLPQQRFTNLVRY